ncbi:MAG TPA: hypothetical protein VK438_00795 [Xanthobacteraceae bacterium]|nr:hypothetical protein [Xanthobacteraceae bacterium]
MRTTLTAAILATSLTALLAANADAQPYSNGVVSRCSQVVGQMKFEGWPAERNQDMMTRACEQNGGSVPGAWSGQEQRPAALRTGPRARQH